MSSFPSLKHDAKTQTVFLLANETTKEENNKDSFLDIKLGDYRLQLPIEATFESCQVSKLSFAEKVITLDYKVGSETQIKDLPKLL